MRSMAQPRRVGTVVVLLVPLLLAAPARCEAPRVAHDNWGEYRAYICRYAEVPPVIDGRLDDVCWAQADLSQGFHPRNADRYTFAEPRTDLRMCYDASALYIAFRCVEPNAGALPTQVLRRDFDVYTEDMVGLIIDVGHWRGFHYDIELAVDAAGTQYDFGWGLEEAWNGEWTAATQRVAGEGWWSAEFRIPYSDTRRRAEKGDLWGIQLFRWRYAGGAEEVSIWSPVPASWNIKFWEALTFGHLLFETGDEILRESVREVAEHLWGQREEALRLAERSSDAQGNRARVEEVFAGLNALQETAAKGLALTGDEWSEALHRAAQLETELADIIWPLRIEELFAQ